MDVRRSSVSRYRPEFAKDRLRAALEAKGIDDICMSELGVPREVLSQLAASTDWERFGRWYNEDVIPHLMNAAMKRLTETARQPMAFTCVGHDPTKCHRRRTAMAVGPVGLRGADLGGASLVDLEVMDVASGRL